VFFRRPFQYIHCRSPANSFLSPFVENIASIVFEDAIPTDAGKSIDKPGFRLYGNTVFDKRKTAGGGFQAAQNRCFSAIVKTVSVCSFCIAFVSRTRIAGTGNQSSSVFNAPQTERDSQLSERRCSLTGAHRSAAYNGSLAIKAEKWTG